MTTRREFLSYTGSAMLAGSLPAGVLAETYAQIERRAIPCGCELMPVIGLGNSVAFKEGDAETTRRMLEMFTGHGGGYVDCAGDSALLVGKTSKALGVNSDVFLGAYFSGSDDAGSREAAARLLQASGKTQLNLMHNVPEDAEPNWDTFRAWKEDGLCQYIGVARHVKEMYPTMMKLMKSGTCDFVQVNYSLLETDAEEELLPLAMEEGVAITINRPFINGEYFDVVRGHELPEWAAEFDCHSWAQFSLKFILSHPAVHCVLTETANPKHLLDNLGGGIGRMPDEKTRQRMREHIQTLV